MTTPAIGDTTFLQSYLINTRVYGVVVPPGNPPEFLATYEVQGDQGTLLIAVAVGNEGPAGANMFPLTLQNDTIDATANLPQTLTNTVADIGKYWIIDDIDADDAIIGSSMYVWYGTTWRRLMLGSPGPPGPVPIITPTLAILPPGVSSTMTEGGTLWEPTMNFSLSVPAGPQGPAAALALAPDVDFTTNPPGPGDVLGFTGTTTPGYLSPAAGLVAIGLGTGGTLAATTYYYEVTAINAGGETTPSNEATVTTTGTTSKVTLDWMAAGSGNYGPTGYKIYRGNTASGGSGSENKLIGTTAPSILTFTDTGFAGSTNSPPTFNTASANFPVLVPVSISQLIPGPYSMPEGAFTSFSGISQAAAIGSFSIPPQPFPWTPIVWGHIGAFGVELSANPLMIGCEVLLGNPTTGAVVGRGFGNTLGEVNIMPHYSAPGFTGVAITPYNGVAVVPANHTNPAQGTIYVNLFNDGDIGLYVFSPTDAQLFVMLVPVTD
jgi:hypothetical protein